MINLGVDSLRAAVIAIDCHRGHLDAEVATMPAPAETARRLIEANDRFLTRCRDRGVPVVHLVTTYRDADEIRANPFWRTRAEDPAAQAPPFSALGGRVVPVEEVGVLAQECAGAFTKARVGV